MAVSSQESGWESPNDSFPLLIERPENHENHEHAIDIDASPTSSSHSASPRAVSPHHENRASTSITITQSPSSSPHGSNSQGSSVSRRGEGRGRHHWSPLNTVLWISIELVFMVGEIIAAVIVLSLSRHEHPKTPLFAWIVGYTVGCVASLPILYWRYLHRNRSNERVSPQSQQGSPRNATSEPNSYITISLTRSSEEEDGHNTSAGTWDGQHDGSPNARLSVLLDHLKMALDCFFAVWFVVGNVWIFGGHSSAADAPNLYRLCIVFLTFSCIGYAMPFILCAMICCCLPCLISMLGVREGMNGTRGATEESINALPTHKFKLKRNVCAIRRDSNANMDEGGIVAAGTEKERVISGEDAVCCICLSRYEDDEELRELPCSHFFHVECVDKWLKINASCPLCKFEIVESSEDRASAADADQQG